MFKAAGEDESNVSRPNVLPDQEGGAEDIKNDYFIDRYLRFITGFEMALSQTKGVEEIEQFYRSNIGIPSVIKDLDYSMDLFKRIDHQDSEDFGSPFDFHMNFYSYHELGYVSESGDMWFTGLQGSGNMGSIFISDAETVHYEGITDEAPNNNRAFYYKGKWRKLELEGENIISRIDDEKLLLFRRGDIRPDNFPIKFGSGGAIIKGQDWFDAQIFVNYGERYSGRDFAFINYDVFDKEKRIYILPFTVCYQDFDQLTRDLNQTDSQGRCYIATIYYNPEDFRTDESSVFIIDAEKDTLYQLRHPIIYDASIEKPLAGHYVIGEDDNLYFQLVTDRSYIIYQIIPDWDGPMEDAEYNPLCFEVHPELEKLWKEFE